jgi:uncharacterized protein YozE (UPF0346 family)
MAALMSFYDWLAKQKNLRTSLGGFAREIVRDAGFPRDVVSLDVVLDHLRTSPNVTPQTLAVARTAFRTYERSQAGAIRS